MTSSWEPVTVTVRGDHARTFARYTPLWGSDKRGRDRAGPFRSKKACRAAVAREAREAAAVCAAGGGQGRVHHQHLVLPRRLGACDGGVFWAAAVFHRGLSAPAITTTNKDRGSESSSDDNNSSSSNNNSTKERKGRRCRTSLALEAGTMETAVSTCSGSATTAGALCALPYDVIMALATASLPSGECLRYGTGLRLLTTPDALLALTNGAVVGLATATAPLPSGKHLSYGSDRRRRTPAAAATAPDSSKGSKAGITTTPLGTTASSGGDSLTDAGTSSPPSTAVAPLPAIVGAFTGATLCALTGDAIMALATCSLFSGEWLKYGIDRRPAAAPAAPTALSNAALLGLATAPLPSGNELTYGRDRHRRRPATPAATAPGSKGCKASSNTALTATASSGGGSLTASGTTTPPTPTPAIHTVVINGDHYGVVGKACGEKPGRPLLNFQEVLLGAKTAKTFSSSSRSRRASQGPKSQQRVSLLGLFGFRVPPLVRYTDGTVARTTSTSSTSTAAPKPAVVSKEEAAPVLAITAPSTTADAAVVVEDSNPSVAAEEASVVVIGEAANKAAEGEAANAMLATTDLRDRTASSPQDEEAEGAVVVVPVPILEEEEEVVAVDVDARVENALLRREMAKLKMVVSGLKANNEALTTKVEEMYAMLVTLTKLATNKVGTNAAGVMAA